MAVKTVEYTVRHDLCSGCGVCKGICPTSCISWDRVDGQYLPHIGVGCVSCGLCAAVCPGLGHVYEPQETAEQTVTGSILSCFNAWSNDPTLRHISASGGVVSTIIRRLLREGLYDGAFCLDSYDYRDLLKTRLFGAEEWETQTATPSAPKSRYLPVSHEQAVTYMKSHRDQKLILVGTSCALRGLSAAIAKLGLVRDNYLLVGPFCDKIFTYSVLPYLQDTYANGQPLAALHFKNKESGGWPGDMKFYPQDGSAFYVPLPERAKAKAYFMPERCLYCVDKLNVTADLSLGDNYTGKDESSLGSNSVILRTERGQAAWDAARDELTVCPIDLSDIQRAQYLTGRLNNLYFGDLKSRALPDSPDLNRGIPREGDATEYAHARDLFLKKLAAGKVYETDPAVLRRQIKKDNQKPNPILAFPRRVLRAVYRRIKR